MAAFGTARFKGIIPKMEPFDLPDEYATVCQNAFLDQGTLAPIKGLTLIEDLGAGPFRSIYKMGSTWLKWAGRVDLVKAEIAESDHRIFWTDGAYPKQTNATLNAAGTNYRLGCRGPYSIYPSSSAPSITLMGTATNSTVVQTTSYVYTYVDSFGEESAPSAPTAVVNVLTNQYVRLSNFQIPSVETVLANITHIRIYRLEDDGAGGSQYMLIGARPVNNNSAELQDIPVSYIENAFTYVYDSNSAATPTGLTPRTYESLPSEEWEVLPWNALNLVQFQNGILAATFGNEIAVSEPLMMYAWPLSLRNITQHDIMGLGVSRECLVIPTKAYPYLLSGSDPQSMVLEKLPYKQACLSRIGVLSTDLGVIYPSPDGLYLVDPSKGQLLTEHLLTKDQWTSGYYPSSLLSFYYDEQYYGWRTGYPTGFILDLVNPDSIRTIQLPVNYGVWDSFYDAENDILYLLVYNSSTATYQIVSAFTNSTQLAYTWKSKLYRYNTPISMTTARIFADFSTGVTFKLYADGVLKFTKAITDNKPFRLVGGFRAKTWQAELTGTDKVSGYQVGTSTEELLRMPIHVDHSSYDPSST